MRTLAILALAVLVASTRSVSAQDLPRKKLIQTGWDQVNPERLRNMIDMVEQRPFQGQVIRFTGRGQTPAFRFAFQHEEWDMAAIEQVIEDLQAAYAASKAGWERFLLVNANPGDVDWFDDEGWASIVEHWRIAARVAREGGLIGILFDPEPYREPHRQFAWTSQPQFEHHTFVEYHQKARQRGGEVMQAITEEYPEITLFCYFMNSVNSMAAERTNPIQALAGGTYDLLPGFIDGWLDEAPPTVTFVDGCEQAYRFNSQIDYLGAYNRIKSDCQRLVSPENRAKYRAQVQVGFGVYLDPYINPPDDRWYIDPKGMERVERLGQNVSYALQTADEYVWVYGEKASWWPTPHPRADAQRWPEALPGIEDQLRAAADPVGFALQKMHEAGADLQNLLVNGDFQPESVTEEGGEPQPDWEEEGTPPGWSFWQHRESSGTRAWDRETGHEEPGSARMAGVTSGCFLQKVAVNPGERYGVVAWRRIEGEGDASIRVRWQTPDNAWHVPHLDVMIDTTGPRDEWAQMVGVVTVPEGAGFMVPLLNASGQRSAADVIWWDDVLVFRL
ncbi:MAG: hypothetical protein U9R79_22845 [Armatimonadota bacterium]|nr:hypothetical protein [Armatimonadota bacterium]